MDFFEHQERARKQTVKLIVLFALAVLVIMATVSVLLLAALTYGDTAAGEPAPNVFSPDYLWAHLDILLVIALVTGALIGLASLVRSQKLSAGGSVVAREMGGTPVEPDTRDPLKRRYRNVVEEMAIASGVPVPDIYVLEQEPGINAFAAGYSTSDAAVAVTRGTLEKLNREELKGVVAHEFAHILNGDMRLNIRLIGILFGILGLAIVGRLLMHSSALSRNRNAGGAVMVGLAIMLIGYIGVFFGRWIKASVSRQREYLADASAVQFTRNPQGIGGALKKIAAAQHGSVMEKDSEEVGHMLFSSGFSAQMMATHPPLDQRIRALGLTIESGDLEKAREDMARHTQSQKAQQEEGASGSRSGSGHMDLNSVMDQIGQPGMQQILSAALLASALPQALERAAHSEEWAPELVCALVLSGEAEIRERQLEMILESMGPDSEKQVRNLTEAGKELSAEQRLPLLEMAFPVVRHLPFTEADQLVALVERLVRADGRIDVSEYALARLLRKQIEEVRNPKKSRATGRKRIADCRDAADNLIRILAHHGHESADQAVAAMTAGTQKLGWRPGNTEALRENWHERLDQAIVVLDELRPADKKRLLEAMIETVQYAGEVVPSEAELLRVICACLHVPLPPLQQPQQ